MDFGRFLLLQISKKCKPPIPRAMQIHITLAPFATAMTTENLPYDLLFLTSLGPTHRALSQNVKDVKMDN